MEWRNRLRPGSFRGVEFKVETGGRLGGRRAAVFEFPKRDKPYTEDMGRRAKRFGITCYVIGADYLAQADALEEALNSEGAGLLVHPTMGEIEVVCETSNRTERREVGGMAMFDITFVEAGSPMASRATESTQRALEGSAEGAADTIKKNGDARLSGGGTGVG